jgi:hypothetical protein
MTSSETTFSAVRAQAEAAFPSAEPTAAELTSQARTALYVGIGGAVLGLAGIGIGLAGLRSRRAK